MQGYAPSVEVGFPIPDIICSLNTDQEFIRENIESNVKLGIVQVEPHETQDKVVALVLGGPSLKDTFEDLKEKKRNGMPVITVNGSYEYCIKNGVTPSAMVMLDAREFNSRFVDRRIDTCKYLFPLNAIHLFLRNSKIIMFGYGTLREMKILIFLTRLTTENIFL